MLWIFHSRVFPRPGNRTGDQATGIFISLSEQETTLNQALSACRKASYRMCVWIETFRQIAHILKPNLTCCDSIILQYHMFICALELVMSGIFTTCYAELWLSEAVMVKTGSLKLYQNRPGSVQGECCLKLWWIFARLCSGTLRHLFTGTVLHVSAT
jgi:hypothetical protein